MSEIYDKISKEIPFYIQHYVDVSFDIADRIHEIMEQKGLSQKDLATALGKQESEISKWLSGTHNFTLKTVAKITEVLQEDIITVPKAIPYSDRMTEEISDNVVAEDAPPKTKNP